MPLTLNTVDEFQEYLQGVIERASHHATNVRNAVLALAGAVVLFKDAEQPLTVRTHAGSPANILWVYVGGRRFALAYNHEATGIELRDRTIDGTPLLTITNSTPTESIIEFFESVANAAA